MNRPQLTTALAVTALLTTAWSGAAQAQTCAPGTAMPTFADPANAEFQIEGPLATYDRTARTIKVFNTTIKVPTTQLIETGHGKFITFETWTDPTLEASRSIIGGTIKGGGVSVDRNNDGCMEFEATDLYFEFDENILVGPLTESSYDAANQTVYVQGATVKMNTDPRLPSVILDASGNPVLSFSDLAGHAGEIIAPEGYYDATDNVLYAIALETGIFIPSLTTDNVIIEQARQTLSDEESRVRIRGFISPSGAATVDVYAPGLLNDALNACTGTLAGTVPVAIDPATGEAVFDYEHRIDVEEILRQREDDGIETEDANGNVDLSEWYVGTTCVQSAGGGATAVEVDQR